MFSRLHVRRYTYFSFLSGPAFRGIFFNWLQSKVATDVMGEIKVCQGARYFSWGFNSFLNMSRPVWDKMACIREMGALLIYMGANLCILHQGFSKCKKLRMQIYAEWLSICSNLPNYIFKKYFVNFIHCLTTFKDQLPRVLVNKFTSQCPVLLWSWYKKRKSQRKTTISSQRVYLQGTWDFSGSKLFSGHLEKEMKGMKKSGWRNNCSSWNVDTEFWLVTLRRNEL